MPVKPHRFLSLGCHTLFTGMSGTIKMARIARVRKSLRKRILREKGQLTGSYYW